MGDITLGLGSQEQYSTRLPPRSVLSLDPTPDAILSIQHYNPCYNLYGSGHSPCKCTTHAITYMTVDTVHGSGQPML